MINVRGYRRTFSINCLSSETPEPIRELTLSGVFAINDVPIITNLEIDVLPSASIQARQALSVSIDTSYELPENVGINRASGLFKKFTTAETYVNFLFIDNQESATEFSDLGNATIYSINLFKNTFYAVNNTELTGDDGEINVSVVAGLNNPTDESIAYQNIPEDFREYDQEQKDIIDASVFLD